MIEVSYQDACKLFWHLRSDFYMIGKQGSFHVVQFDNKDDKEYIYANSPWFMQGALLVFIH